MDNVVYQVHLGYVGWCEPVKNGDIAGFGNKMCSIQAVKVWSDNGSAEVGVKVYYPESGWSEEAVRGEMAGTTGACRDIFGISIRLLGKNDNHILYRVRGHGTDWSDWGKDGEPLYNDMRSLTDLQVQLVPESELQFFCASRSEKNESMSHFLHSLDYILGRGECAGICRTVDDAFTGFTQGVASQSYFGCYSELEKLAQKYGTDKNEFYHNYTRKYDFFLSKWRKEKIKVLELGVCFGASLKMWGEYFPHAEVIGVDIDKACEQYAGGNRQVVITDLSKVENLEVLSKINPEVIVDDASHIWSHQIKAFFSLFPSLKSGGIYILEDLGTSFPLYRGKGWDDAEVSTYEVLSAIAEVVTSSEKLEYSLKNPVIARLADRIELAAMEIEMICFIHESCVIIKK